MVQTMSQTYNRVSKHILKSRTDCIKRMNDVEADNIKAFRDTKTEIKNLFLNMKKG